MWYLYGTKRDGSQCVVATFDSEQALLTYASWATLQKESDGTLKFEQNTPLTGCTGYEHSQTPPEDEDNETLDVPHHPTPGML